MHSAIPYSRKHPQSLYNSSSNRSAVERSLAQPSITARINVLAQVIASAFSTKPSLLENRLTAVFLSSVETESKEYYAIWDRILSVFEDATERNAESRDNWDDSVGRMMDHLNETIKNDHSDDDWETIISDLTRKLRLILGKLKGKQIGQAVEQVWAVGVYVSYLAIGRVKKDGRRDGENKKKEEIVKLEPMECPAVLLFKLVLPIQNEAKEEIEQLKATIERLHKDADHYVSLIKDRESELHDLHNFPNMRDFDRFSDELTAYLEDAAGRQTANLEVLENISQLINHKLPSGLRSKKRGARPSISISGSPELMRQKSRSSTMDEPGSPGKKSGKHTQSNFYPGDKPNAESRGNTPRMPEPIKIERLLVSAGTNTAPMDRLAATKDCPASPLRPANDLTTIGHISIHPVESSPPPSPAKQAQSSSEGLLVEEVNMTVSEENESESESVSPRFDHKEVQTDLTLFSPDGLVAGSLSAVCVQTRHCKPNILLLQIEKLAKKQPPMPDKLVFKLFESAMEEKNRSDTLEMEAGRTPKTMTEFMLDFMYMQYGLKTLTLKSLSALVNALEGMASRGDKYGVLFCRMLEVFTQEPIDDTLASFLTKARSAFVSLRQPKQSLVKSSVEQGGSISLLDVADLLFVLFTADRDTGEVVLSRLAPADLSDADLTAILLCGKLAKTGRELKFFYIQIDTEKTGMVKYSAFEKGIRETCEVLVSKEKVLALWKAIGAETLSFQQLSKVNFKENSMRAGSRELAVTKCDFMLEIAREYDRKRALEREQLTNLFRQHDPTGEGVISLADFTLLLTTLTPSLSRDHAVSIFREALDLSEKSDNLDSLDADSFCQIALKHRLGNAGNTVFDSDLRQLSARLKDKFVRYEHDLGDMAVATNKFRRK